MENERFKLVTRRFIAWFLVATAVVAALFLVVYGAVNGQAELAIMGGTVLFVELGTVVGFYFGKKISEE